MLTGALLASLTSWVSEARGRDEHPRVVEVVGTVARTAAVLAGGLHVAADVVEILH